MVPAISMSDFLSLKNVSVIDVRDDEEYAMGHIPGSIHMPLDTFDQSLFKLNKDEVHYIICQSGARSQFACMIAASQGYKVVNMLGGMNMYKGENSYEVG